MLSTDHYRAATFTPFLRSMHHQEIVIKCSRAQLLYLVEDFLLNLELSTIAKIPKQRLQRGGRHVVQRFLPHGRQCDVYSRFLTKGARPLLVWFTGNYFFV